MSSTQKPRGSSANSARLGIAILSACGAIAHASTAHAATYYWRTASGVWEPGGNTSNWSTSSGSTPNTAWANSTNDAVIETVNPTITPKVSSSTAEDLTLRNLTVNQGMTLNAPAMTGSNVRTIILNGAGIGDFTMGGSLNDAVNATFRLVLNGTSGYNGRITNNAGSTRVDIIINKPTATSTATKIDMSGTPTGANTGAGRLAISGDITSPSAPAVIGELRGTSTAAQITSQYSYPDNDGPRYLKIDQATDTTFAGKIADASRIVSDQRILHVEKAGVGTLTLSGTNTALGPTTISGGTLHYAKQQSFFYNSTSPALSSADWNASRLIVNSGATAAFNVGGAGEFSTSDIAIIQPLSTSTTTGFRSGSFIGMDTTNATGGNFTYGTAINDTNSNANSIGLTKLGSGTLTLTASNGYTGATQVKAGSLRVNGSLNAASAVTVSSGATLGGTGDINGAVTIALGGKLAPGASVGALETGALTLSNGFVSEFEFQSDANNPSADPTRDYDFVNVTGAMSYGTGAFNILKEGDTATFGGLGTYTLFTSTGLTGVPTGLSVNNPAAGRKYTFSNSSNSLVLDIAAINFARLVATGAAGADTGTPGGANANVIGGGGSYAIGEVQTNGALVGHIDITGDLSETPVYVLLDVNDGTNVNALKAFLNQSFVNNGVYTAFTLADDDPGTPDVLNSYQYSHSYDILLAFGTNPSLGTGEFQFEYDLTGSGVAGLTSLNYIGVVPEPSTAAILALGTLGAFASRRRRKM